MSKRQQDNWTKNGSPKKRAVTNLDRIKQVNKQAMKRGLSYGKYVAQYGYEIEQEEK